ncbi:MAG: hypothetical protein NTW28_23700 [Candidatus Solibacter sp.]|nr:hypothetical protein [Candidatus Solibacter sp.]
MAEFVAADAFGTGGEIAATEALDGLLEYANRAGKVQSQPVAEPDGGGHDEEVCRLKEPGADIGARHDEEEPVAAVIGDAGDGGIAGAEYLVEHAPLGVADQVGAVFISEQVAAVFVGEDAAGVIDAMQGIEEALERGAPAGLVCAGGFLQLEADQPGDRRAFVAIVFIHVEGGDEGRPDHRDGEGEPEPKEDFGEEGVHSATVSSGVRQNW